MVSSYYSCTCAYPSCPFIFNSRPKISQESFNRYGMPYTAPPGHFPFAREQQIRLSPSLCADLLHVHKCVWNGRLSRQCLLQWFGHFAFSSIVCVSTNQRSSKKKFSNRWESCNKCRIFRLGRCQDSPRAFKVHDHCPSIFHARFFQQHANNQEIDTIANCHATFQYIARRLGRLGDGTRAAHLLR